MTGASHRLRQLLDRFGPDLRLFRDQIQPKVQKLREVEANWLKLKGTLTSTQKDHIDKFGYAPMDKKQIEIAYEGKADNNSADDFLRQLKGKQAFEQNSG